MRSNTLDSITSTDNPLISTCVSQPEKPESPPLVVFDLAQLISSQHFKKEKEISDLIKLLRSLRNEICHEICIRKEYLICTAFLYF